MSNLILQFLSVPRADTRRYEILRLIASFLQWNDAEREKAGLQRQSDRSSSYNFLGLGGLLSSQQRQPSQSEDKSPGDEVRMFGSPSPLPISLSSSSCRKLRGPRRVPGPPTSRVPQRLRQTTRPPRSRVRLISTVYRTSIAPCVVHLNRQVIVELSGTCARGAKLDEFLESL